MQQNKHRKTRLKRFFLYFCLALLLVIGFISIRYPYIYHAIGSTFLRGQKSPDIFDLSISPYNQIKTFHPVKLNKRSASIKSQDIKGFDAYNKSLKTIAFLVALEDTLIFEKYYENHTPDKVSNSFSMAKTVISFLIGIAVEEGKIQSLDDDLKKYLPTYSYSTHYRLTIRDLLQMASGTDWVESGRNPFTDNAAAYYGSNLSAFIYTKKVVQQPGEFYNYQSGNTQLLAMVLTTVYQKNISELCQEKIWNPMEMSHHAYWSTDDKKEEKAYCCLYATPSDFLKLGSLFLHKGTYKGRTIIPAWYIHEMTHSKATKIKASGNENQLYGLHVWTYNDPEEPLVYFRGILGQYIIVSPNKKWIAVRLGHQKQANVQPASKNKIDLINEGHSTDFIEYVKFVKEIVNHGTK